MVSPFIILLATGLILLGLKNASPHGLPSEETFGTAWTGRGRALFFWCISVNMKLIALNLQGVGVTLLIPLLIEGAFAPS